ncbi:hypothetical protein FA13DRAFT_1790285 [Coprinellus micaceus]|uniref:Uncharacterized protein n=1 Tax=Coprinellus micaceus TaxID=71717 RepID=A0A4Y7TGG4_COPMI|nr:hypothetical protein FA13DRAFT_1790285 [Coprinellus micaceus]
MDTHGIHRRQPHSALRKKRFQPARLPGLHDLGVEKSTPVDRRSLEGRQLTAIPELPGFTIPLSDIFPPVLPTQSSTTELPATPTTTSSTSTSQETTSTSTTTSTTSSTTTSTTPTTTSTTQAPPPTTTSTPTTSTSRVVVTEVDNETAVLTSFFGQSSTATPSSTTLSSNDGGDDSNTGPIVGGIVAGVIALVVVLVALVWWIRRRGRGKLENDITPFSPHDFRRSAYLINDDPSDSPSGAGPASLSRGPTLHRGGFGDDDPMNPHAGIGATPRPPSMIERRLAQTPANSGGYDGGFNPNVYPSSSHGHGEQYYNGAPQMSAHAHPMPLHYNYDGGAPSGEGYGYGAGVGVGAGAPYGFNQFQVYGDHPHYSGVPFERYGPEQGGAHEPQNPFGHSADPNIQNPFMTPSQSQAPQLQSPFSPTPSSAHEVVAEDAESAVPGTAVLAQVGGAAVLTRSVSVKSKHSKSNLSISIPKSIPVNATAVNGSAVSSNEEEQTKNAAVAYPALKRQGSSSSVSTSRSGSSRRGNAAVKAPPPALPIKEEDIPPSSDYVDLARSSVSPFQAAQYAEISKRLNTDVPQGLPNTLVDEYVTTATTRDRDLPPLPPPGQGTTAEGHRTSAISNTDSSGSSITAPNMMFDFPIPPPSPLTVTSRHSHSSLASGHDNSHFAAPKVRIDSLPPQLPEISIGSSSSSSPSNSKSGINHDSFLNPPPGMSVMMSMGLNSAKDSPIYPSGITAGASPLLGKFPVTPSPLGMSFDFESQAQTPVPKVPELDQGRQGQDVKQSKGKEKERPMTVYDEADAYGGI